VLFPAIALAQDAPKIDTGDTAWVLASAALVLLMTPGLAFFYGGMVRTKNVVTTLFQSFSAFAVGGLIWAICGYSLAFSKGTPFLGGFEWALLGGVGQEPNPDYSATVPHLGFMIFQAMFAIITPALFTGAFAERVKFKGWLALCALWSLVVYVPVAHWVWGVGGWIRDFGGLDFAGGMVVHMTAGFSALALAIALGRRKDFGAAHKPYDVGYVAVGTGLLFFGWLGFNGGSALGANGLAAQAVANTTFAGCASFATWMLVDSFVRGKASLVGACIALVAGLVAVTPAAGFVTTTSALLIGAITGVVVNFACSFVKNTLKIDDTLDVFACHGIGGTLGTILTGVFATKAVNSAGGDGILFGGMDVMKGNITGALVVAAYSFIATFILAKVVSAVFGLRVDASDEETGLDATQHDELVNSNFEGAAPAHGPATIRSVA
jgi:Amt family ammonium transporter